jgi:hypothetical protein
MFNFIQFPHMFNFAIRDAYFVVEKPGRELKHRVIDVAVDSGSQDGSAIGFEVRWEVGSAPKETDAKWGFHDYHGWQYLRGMTEPLFQ